MASGGKRGKKSKTKLSLQSFLADDKGVIQEGYSIVTPKRCDWAAEMEKEGLDCDSALDPVYSGQNQYILPSAPLGPNIDLNKVPNAPPYTAFLGNLSYEIDKDDICAFFKDLKISSVRLPRSGGDTGRPRGFGYVEFENRQSLIDALEMSDSYFKNSRIKIDVAESQDDPNRRRDSRGDRMDRGDRAERMAVLSSDWRSCPREEPSGPVGRDRGFKDEGGFRDRDGLGDRFSSDRDRDRFGRSGFSSDRDHDYRDDRDRHTGFGGSRSFSDRSERNRPFERGDRYGGRDSYNGYDRGGRSGRRDFGMGFRGEEKQGDYNRGGYDRDRYGGSSGYGESLDRGEKGASERDVVSERPRLVLEKRTKPLELSEQPAVPSAIFGGAKPVNTAAREWEIEERLAKEFSAKLAQSAQDKDRSGRRDDYRVADLADANRRPLSGSQGRTPLSPTSVPSSDMGRPSMEEGSARGMSSQSSGDESGPPPSRGERLRKSEFEKDTTTSYSNRSDNSESLRRAGREGDRTCHPNNNSDSRRDGPGGRARDDKVPQGGIQGGNVRANYGGEKWSDGKGGTSHRPAQKEKDKEFSEGTPRELPKCEEPPLPAYMLKNKFSNLPRDEGNH